MHDTILNFFRRLSRYQVCPCPLPNHLSGTSTKPDSPSPRFIPVLLSDGVAKKSETNNNNNKPEDLTTEEVVVIVTVLICTTIITVVGTVLGVKRRNRRLAQSVLSSSATVESANMFPDFPLKLQVPSSRFTTGSRSGSFMSCNLD